jgi:hypothetical protein
MKTLDEIAIECGTDKSSKEHGYAPIYDELFRHIRHNRIRLLEIGIGGDEDPNKGGASLKMWANYFKGGSIYAIDKYSKNIVEDRITPLQLDQSNPDDLMKLKHKSFDIIVDDGSHQYRDQVETFGMLFGGVNPGGYYCIEDIHTSFWPEFGYGKTKTTMEIFCNLAQRLTTLNTGNVSYRGIECIMFYPSLIVIHKK